MNTKPLLLAGALLCATTGAQAQAGSFVLTTQYDTGYVFPASNVPVPVVLTGTFNGTRNGNVITNLTNVSLFLNGVAFKGNGNLFVAQLNTDTFDVEKGGQLSFDGKASNAYFSDTDLTGGTFNYSNYAYSITGFGENAYSSTTSLFGVNKGIRTSIQDVTVAAAVPEPTTWAMMALGFGLVGAGLRSRAKVRTKVRFS